MTISNNIFFVCIQLKTIIFIKKFFLHNKFWTGNFIKALNLLRQGLGYCDKLNVILQPRSLENFAKFIS